MRFLDLQVIHEFNRVHCPAGAVRLRFVALAVIAIILSFVTPLLRGMQDEGQLTKAEGDLKTIKSAVTSYWRNNSSAYPNRIGTMLTDDFPSNGSPTSLPSLTLIGRSF